MHDELAAVEAKRSVGIGQECLAGRRSRAKHAAQRGFQPAGPHEGAQHGACREAHRPNEDVSPMPQGWATYQP